jgi:hypothetical protein
MSKSMSKWLLCALVATAMVPATVRAEEAAEPAALSAEAAVSVPSAYVWRGQVLNEDPVLQPSFGVSKGGFSLSWWGNMNLTDDQTGEDFEFTEHDITVAYSTTCPLTGADVTLGVVNYDFPNVSVADADGNASLVNNTAEAFASFGFACPANPVIAVYYDFVEADGFYGSLAIGHEVEINDMLAVAFGAAVGVSSSDWNEYYYGTDDDAFNDWNANLGLPVKVTDNLVVTPGVVYTALIDSDISDTVEDNDLYYGETDQVVGSLTASYTF